MQVNKRKRAEKQLSQSRAIKLARENANREHDLKKIGATGKQQRLNTSLEGRNDMGLVKQRGRNALSVSRNQGRNDLNTQGLRNAGQIANTEAVGGQQRQTEFVKGGIAADAADKQNQYDTEANNQALAADVYKSGGKTSDAATIASSGQFSPDYGALKPMPQKSTSSYKMTKGGVTETMKGKTYEPNMILNSGTGEYESDYTGMGIEREDVENLNDDQLRWLRNRKIQNQGLK